MKVVFDTNVIISALGWEGSPRMCLDMARDGRVHGYTCLEILDEVAEVLERKLSIPASTAVEVVEDLLGFLRVVPTTGALSAVEDDPDDDMVVECAVVAEADWIVSGDRHLLSLRHYGGVGVCTPSELLDRARADTGAGST